MPASETESEPEPEPSAGTVSSLTAFACLSATRPSQGLADEGTVSWALDTLATLDFRLVHKDTTLHGLIQKCASAILALLNTVLQLDPTTDSSCSFIPAVVSIFTPSFLHLLFQYRRLFHTIAARDFKQNSAPLAVVCWVDVVLAKLGDVAAFIAAGLHGDHPERLLPESLKTQKEEDNLRAAIQLPDDWDMLPSVLLSERVSAATKRLSIRLMLGRYILCPVLSGQVSLDNDIHTLLSTFAEFVRQSATRVDELRLVLGRGPRYLMQQERLTSAMVISLFAAADMGQDSTNGPERGVAFRPQTIAAAMQLLRFALNEGGHLAQINLLSPLDRLDGPTDIIIRWGIIPQWTWSIWPEYRCLHADTIVLLTTTYIQHHKACPEPFLEPPDMVSVNSRLNDEAAMISVMIDVVSRFISMFSTSKHSKQLSTSMINVLYGSCRLISQWMSRNSCGIQGSKECCKTLIILFGHLSQNERYFAANDLVIECLVLVGEQCMCEAWVAAVEDNNSGFLAALGQSFVQVKTANSWNGLAKSRGIYVAQLMQFLVVMMSKGVQPLDLGTFIEFTETVKEQILEMPVNSWFLCEILLTCLATANLSGIDLSSSKVNGAVDDEAMWHLGTCGGDMNLFLASAFSLYISSTLVGVEPLTHLEGLEHLLDIALLICSRHYPCEDEPLGLIILPTVCNALAHLLRHGDNTTEAYTRVNTRISALGNILRSLSSEEDSDKYSTLLKHRILSTARSVLLEDGGGDRGKAREKGEHELVFCRLNGFSHLLYVTVA